MKKLILLAAVLAASIHSYAQTCVRRDDFVTTAMGQAVPGALVSYYAQPGFGQSPASTASTVYSDAACTHVTIAITDGFGHFGGYLFTGFYTVTYSGPLIQTKSTPDQGIGVVAGAASTGAANSWTLLQTFAGGLTIPTYTVATLPPSPSTVQVAIVRDGTTTADCTVGGSTNYALCGYGGPGVGWIPLGGAGGGGGGSSNFNITSVIPSPATAGKPYLLSNGLKNFLLDNASTVWSPSSYDTNVIAFGADNTGISDSGTALQNAIAAVATSSGQRMYIPSGKYLIGSGEVLHFDREMVVDGAGSGEDYPATTIQLGPKSYAVIDRAGTSPDGGRGDWTAISNIRFLGTFMTCTATASSATLATCSQNPATYLSLNANDPIVVMGSNGAPWQLNMPQGTTAASMTSNSIAASANAAFSGTVTVMAGGPLIGTGTTTSSSTSITGITNCSSWFPGDPIFGPGIAYPNFVISVNCTSNTLTLITAAGSGAGAGNLYKSPLPNLMAKATSRLSNLSCGYSAGHCIDINASASYSPSTIADGFSADAIRIAHSGGLSFHCQGADCNAGKVQGLYMAYGAEGCYRSDSFLGNTVIAGECANAGSAGWSSTNANASEVFINPYQESGYVMPSYNSTNTLVLGGTSSTNAVGGNVITSSGQLSNGFIVMNATGSTGNTTNGSASVTNVTNISQWHIGDTIVGQSTCIPASATISNTDGVSVLTLSANATCTQTGLAFAHTGVRNVLGTQSVLNSVGGFGASINQSNWFYYENQYKDYFASADWGWLCGVWRNVTLGLCYSTDWAVSQEVPPNAGSGAYGNNGGRIKFPNGLYLGDGVNSDLFTSFTGVNAPTSGWYGQGAWSFAQSPTSSSAAAWVQTGTTKAYSTGVSATTAANSTTITSTSTNFQNSCAPNDTLTGTGIPNDTIIMSVNTGAATAVLSRPATAAGSPTLTCRRLNHAHPTVTGTTNGTTTVASVNPINSFANGDMITSSAGDIPANTYVVSGGGTATLVISQAATGSNTGVTLNDPNIQWSEVSFGTGGSGMTYPSGTGIAQVTSGASWGTTYNASNLIPASFLNFSLTTTGSSGAASYNTSTGVLNIPNYAGVSGGSQYAVQYSSNGAGGFAGATNGLTGQTLMSTNGAAPAFTSPGIGARTVTTTTDSISCDSGTALVDRGKFIRYNSSSAVSVTVPDAGTSGCAGNFYYGAENLGSGAVTFNRTTSSTFTTITGSGAPSTGNSFTLTQGQHVVVSSPDNANWDVRLTGGGGGGGVSSITGDGVIITNSGSSGAVTLVAGPNVGLFAYGGDGSDGAATFDGTTTVCGVAPSSSTYALTRDCHFTTVTENSGVTINTNGARLVATTSITINGTVQWNGSNGNTGGNASGTNQSTGGVAGTNGTLTSYTGSGLQIVDGVGTAGVAGAAGGTGAGTVGTTGTAGTTTVVGAASAALSTTGFPVAAVQGGSGGTGSGGSGGAKGTIGAAGSMGAAVLAAWRSAPEAFAAVRISAISPSVGGVGTFNKSNATGSGGASGGGDGTNNGGAGGGSGGNGASGGDVVISAPTITIGATGIVQANGGNAGNGGSGGTPTTGNCGGGGGGASGTPGNGGMVELIYHTLNNSGTVQANAGSTGTGGAAGSGVGSGTAGTAGTNGNAGKNGFVIQLGI